MPSPHARGEGIGEAVKPPFNNRLKSDKMSAKKPDEKRAHLVLLSKKAKKDFPNMKVNDWLLNHYSNGLDGVTPNDWNTFKGWKEKGFKVIKGEKSFPIWGKPRKFKKEIEGGGEKEFSMFPMANLFHKRQVEKEERLPKTRESYPKKGSKEKEDKLAKKFYELAHGMSKEIESKFSPAIASQNPTPRRVRIAAGMRDEGRKLQLAQTVLLAVAEIAEGGCPRWIGELDAPEPINKVNSKASAVAYVQRWEKEIKTALHRSGMEPKANPSAEIKEKINELCGDKIDGFFPTPEKIASTLAQMAELDDARTLLEPSAGYGALIDAALDVNPMLRVTAFEVNTKLSEILAMKQKAFWRYSHILNSDFVEYFSPERFDRVIMNPPFEKGQDMMHVQIAYDKLAQGGVLVAIVCENCFYRKDGEYPDFREWLEMLGAEVVELPHGAFSGTIRSTNVKTRIIKLRK